MSALLRTAHDTTRRVLVPKGSGGVNLRGPLPLLAKSEMDPPIDERSDWRRQAEEEARDLMRQPHGLGLAYLAAHFASASGTDHAQSVADLTDRDLEQFLTRQRRHLGGKR